MGQTGSCGKKRPPTHGGCGEPLHEGANPVGYTERWAAFVEIVAPKERIKRGQSTDVAGAQDVNPGL